MRGLGPITSPFLAITILTFLAPVGNADAPVLECAHISESTADGTSLAGALQTPGSKKVEPSRTAVACQAALKLDPMNSSFMFQLARALTLEKKQLEAIKYYLDAADHGH